LSIVIFAKSGITDHVWELKELIAEWRKTERRVIAGREQMVGAGMVIEREHLLPLARRNRTGLQIPKAGSPHRWRYTARTATASPGFPYQGIETSRVASSLASPATGYGFDDVR
jgi:hypothetical protein